MSLRAERHCLALSGPLLLEGGDALPAVSAAFETYGTLNAARDNAVLVLHGLTSDQHAAGPPWHAGGKQGWWNAAIGPGRAIDTDRFYVIAVNALGGAGGGTAPASIDPADGRRYAMRFPVVTIGDMAEQQRRLLDALGIARLHATIGGCMGGFQVLEWLRLAPERTGRTVVISATPRVSTHTVALWSVLRAAVMSDPAWNGGDYYDGPAPDAGAGLLAAIGALFWMDRQTLAAKFGLRTIDGAAARPTLAPQFAVEKFLADVQASAAGKLDPNTMIYLTRAMDLFDLTRGRPDLAAQFARVRDPVLLVSYRYDWRYPPSEMAELDDAFRAAGAPCQHVTLSDPSGHGAFLFAFDSLAPILSEFMAR